MTLSTDSALLVGDTHANTPFLLAALRTARHLDLPTVIQLGDFGYWPHAHDFLRLAALARSEYHVDLWFIDGNHEHHHALALATRSGTRLDSSPASPVELSPGFIYLPRGSVVTIASRRTLCVGGAVSLDRSTRTPGVDWFPEERLDDQHIASAISAGPVDILLSHDAPAGWTIPGLSLPQTAWVKELPAAYEHRLRLEEVFNTTTPSTVFHGHYHTAYALELERPWGKVDVYGLGHDGHNLWGARVMSSDGLLQVDPIIGRPSPEGYRGDFLGVSPGLSQ